MGEDESKLVFSGFREDAREAISGKVLKFIHVQIKGSSLVFRKIGATHGGHLELGDADQSQELGVEITNLSFGEIDQQDFSFVHGISEIKRRFWLADGISHDAVRDKGTEFRAEIGNHFLAFPFSGLGVLVFPEGLYDGIFYLRNFVFHKFLIDEDSRHIDQRGTFVFVFHEGETGIAEVVLDTRSEDFVSEKLDEDLGGL